ncbi:uncharacterized protein LOC109804075 isoform X3 [Cajanus cajan]|uniref:uncharacterized protein LOC109804075 isoform X3 n=1 Tax=Cajanus cajan TaxID=3821 RepID=UPI00098DB34B|nr:uncharacterized protein LOC109804075 isoform X3 [Cajanus cajan]
MGVSMWKSMHQQIRCTYPNPIILLFFLIQNFLLGRVFCKKGCNSDGETWEECLEECNQICYKDPVLKDQQWSAYIDRSPGAASYSEFDVKQDTVDKVSPNRPPKPAPVQKPRPQPVESIHLPEDMPGTSA